MFTIGAGKVDMWAAYNDTTMPSGSAASPRWPVQLDQWNGQVAVELRRRDQRDLGKHLAIRHKRHMGIECQRHERHLGLQRNLGFQRDLGIERNLGLQRDLGEHFSLGCIDAGR